MESNYRTFLCIYLFRLLKRIVLHKLLRHGFAGGRHTGLENIPKGFPGHLHKELMKTDEKLNKKDLITLKPKGYGMHISLNPRKLAEIEEIIRDL